MRSALPLAMLTAAGLAATPAAHAAAPWTLDAIEINGVKSVPADQLRAGLKDHPGDKVTTDDLMADQDALTKELESNHVVGNVQTAMRNKNNGHIDLIFNVVDQGVQAPTVVHVSPKLGTQTFVGNVKMPTDDLIAATGLHPGDDLSDAKIAAARDAIGAAYKKKNIGLQLAGSVKQDKDRADLIWTITEQKAPKKKKNTDDEGGFQTDQPD